MARHLSSFGDDLLASVAVHHLLIAMKQLSCRSEVVHIGGRGDNCLDQA